MKIKFNKTKIVLFTVTAALVINLGILGSIGLRYYIDTKVAPTISAIGNGITHFFGIDNDNDEELHSQEEIIAAIQEMFPEAQHIKTEFTKVGETNFDKNIYYFNYNGLDFTFTEYQTRDISFMFPSNIYTLSEDNYRERLYEKVSYNKNTDKNLKADVDYNFFESHYTCRAKSYDDLDNAVDVLEEVYNAFYKYLPEKDRTDEILKCRTPNIIFGIYCPTENVASDNIVTIPYEEKYGYIEISKIGTKDNSVNWKIAREEVKKKYKENMNLGYISDPVITADNPVDTDKDLYNNRYITKMYVDNKEYDLLGDREYLFVYNPDINMYCTQYHIGDTSKNEDLLGDFIKAYYPESNYGSVDISGEELGSYTALCYDIGSNHYKIRYDSNNSDKLKVYENDTLKHMTYYYDIKDNESSDRYLNIYDFAELCKLGVEKTDDNKGIVYFSTDVSKYPNPNDNKYSPPESLNQIKHLYIDDEEIFTSSKSSDYTSRIKYDEENGKYYCYLSAYNGDYLFKILLYKLHLKSKIIRNDEGIQYNIENREYLIKTIDDKTLLLKEPTKSYEMKAKKDNSPYNYYIDVYDLAYMLELKVDRIDIEKESIYFVSK